MGDPGEVTSTRGVFPIFLLHADLGVNRREKILPRELCREAAEVVGRAEVEGSQRMNGLWRIYLNTDEGRAKLFSEGMNFRNKSITVYDRNPSLSENPRDDAKPRSKVLIQNIPLSIANEEIKLMLERLGVKEFSDVRYELEHDEEGHLTSFKNGNRSVFIDTETLLNAPLPRNAICCNWRARIWYKEQPKPYLKCYNCYQEGHTKTSCKNTAVCKVCKREGHQPGDEDCPHYLPNNAIPFKGERDEFSNFFKEEIVIETKSFNCGEQAWVAAKAKKNGRTDIYKEVMVPLPRKSEKRLVSLQSGKKRRRA